MSISIEHPANDPTSGSVSNKFGNLPNRIRNCRYALATAQSFTAGIIQRERFDRNCYSRRASLGRRRLLRGGQNHAGKPAGRNRLGLDVDADDAGWVNVRGGGWSFWEQKLTRTRPGAIRGFCFGLFLVGRTRLGVLALDQTKQDMILRTSHVIIAFVVGFAVSEITGGAPIGILILMAMGSLVVMRLDFALESGDQISR